MPDTKIMTSSQNKNILWITERYPPLKGGMAVSCERQVSGLRKRGYDVDVIAFNQSNEGVRAEETARDGGSDIRITREENPGNAAQTAWGLIRLRTAARPYSAVVGFGVNLSGFVAVTLAAWLGVPSLVMARGNDFDRDWFDHRWGRWVAESLSRATLIGSVAPQQAERIRALFPAADVFWCPNGIDVSEMMLLPGDAARRDEIRKELSGGGKRIIGIFGEMKYKKRIPLLLGALRDAGLKDRVALLVAGTADDETTQILDDSSISPVSRRHTFLRREEMPALYAACDYVAVPSLFDGMPNVLLEGMAAGAVPIVSGAGAMSEMVDDGKTGFVFPPEDRAGAAEALARALSLDERELREMSRRAKEHVAANFTIEKEMDILCGAIGKLTK